MEKRNSEVIIRTRVTLVTKGVWCFYRPSYFACSYLIDDPNGAVAIDVGMESDAADFLQGLAEIGIAPERVRAVLLTHWHNDHAAGAAHLKRTFGVPVYYHKGDQDFLTRKTASAGIRGWVGRHIPEQGLLVLLRGLLEEASPEAVAADHLVLDTEILEGSFRVIATPGHTPGHAAYIHEASRTLFCGDALAVVDSRLRMMAKLVTPDVEAARISALRCLREQPRFICPGHRGPLTVNVTQECQRLRAYLEAGGRWPLLG